MVDVFIAHMTYSLLHTIYSQIIQTKFLEDKKMTN